MNWLQKICQEIRPKIDKPAIYVNGKIYTGETHGEAINKAFAAGDVVREPWQMTRDEWRRSLVSDEEVVYRPQLVERAQSEDSQSQSGFEYSSGEQRQTLGAPNLALQALEALDARIRIAYKRHKFFVKQAIENGKPVPLEVLAEYPELKTAKQTESKAMPLPFSRQVPSYTPGYGYPSGAYNIDRDMVDNVATQEEQEHPDMKYLGQGNVGIAYDNNGNVIKYTGDYSEFSNAMYFYDHPCECVAAVLAEPKQIQKNPTIFKLLIEKVRPLTQEENKFLWASLYPSLKECIDKHNLKGIDLHRDNFGINRDNRLVVLDFGAISPSVYASSTNWLKSSFARYLYHGSNQRFQEFDLQFAGRRDYGDLGIGVYLSTETTLAEIYAGETAAKFGGEPIVYLVQCDISKTADFSSNEIKNGLAQLNIPVEKDTTHLIDNKQTRPQQESKMITDYLISQGYDSAMRFDGSGEIVVFDASKIKIISVISDPEIMDDYGYQKTSQKDMPLPFQGVGVPLSQKPSDYWGASNIHEKMREQTAHDQESRHPHLQYFDQGNVGLVYEENGNIIKYTYSREEFEMASHLYNNPIPCTVKVMEPPIQIQKQPDLYKIVLEKVQRFGDKEKYNLYNSPRYFDLNKCLESNGLEGYDLHSKNIGVNSSGQWVVLDMGSIDFADRAVNRDFLRRRQG